MERTIIQDKWKAKKTVMEETWRVLKSALENRLNTEEAKKKMDALRILQGVWAKQKAAKSNL